jgi:type I restriction enzyme S subunit
MKESGVEWIGQIPEDWETVRLKKYFKPLKVVAGENHDNYPRLSLAKVGVIEREKYDGNGQSPADYSTYQIVKKDEFVLNLMGLEQDSDYARVGVPTKEGLVSSGYNRVDRRNPDDIVTNFGLYFFKTMEQRRIFNIYGKGIRATLNGKELMQLPFAYPPVSEQQKIADFLDEKTANIDKIIAETKQSIEELKAYKQSIITEAVTKGLDKDAPMKDSGVEWIGEVPQSWTVRKLKSLSTIERGQFSHRPRNDERYYGGEYPFVQTGDVARSDKWINTYSQTLSELGTTVSKSFPKGTMLMAIAANVGDVALLTFDSYLPDSVLGIAPLNNINNEFLYYALKSQREQLDYNSTSSTQKNLNVESVGNTFIAYPADDEQVFEIVEHLVNVDKNIGSLISDKLSIIKQFESYKKSMIYEYVTGKLEVN